MKPETMFTIHKLNSEAKKHNLKLVRIKDGYFTWLGLTDDMSEKLELDTIGERKNVYVYRFTHMSAKQWIEELEYLVEKISKSDV